MKSLLEEHVPRVWRFALRLTGDRHQAEDLTQETFLKAWRHRRRLRDPHAARGWLFQITINLWRDQVRRAKRGREAAALEVDPQTGNRELPDRQIVDQEDLDRVLEAMDGLPGRQREVLYLHACEGFTATEIAEVLSITTAAVKSSLCEARKKMRQKVCDVCPNQSPAG